MLTRVWSVMSLEMRVNYCCVMAATTRAMCAVLDLIIFLLVLGFVTLVKKMPRLCTTTTNLDPLQDVQRQEAFEGGVAMTHKQLGQDCGGQWLAVLGLISKIPLMKMKYHQKNNLVKLEDTE